MSRHTADTLVALLVLGLLAGCAAGVPAASPAANATATLSATPSAPTTPAANEPPQVDLVLPAGTSLSGRLGSWCYGNACADVIIGPAENQPRAELPGPGTDLEARAEGASFVYWRASYRAADDDSADMAVLAEGGTRNPDPDEVQPTGQPPLAELSSLTFEGPPSGEWLLEVRLEFPNGGAAPYHWYAVVP